MKSIYPFLSKIKFLSKNYALKFLFIAFIGIHIPLLGVIAVVVAGKSSTSIIILTALSCTLVACFLTLYILKSLLAPLQNSCDALERYNKKHELPYLPMEYEDEAGRLMQQIQITIHHLDDLLKEKLELAALLSHDIRSPLASITCLADMMLEQQDVNTMHDLLKELRELSKEQLQSVQVILDKMVEAEVSDTPLVLNDTNIKVLSEKVTKSVAGLLRSKNIEVVNNIDTTLNVLIDEEHVEHVLLNLLTNAIKFSYPFTAIKLYTENDNGFVLVNIQDSGIGFKKGVEKDFFKMYTPARRMGTAGEQSTGMGLYLSKKIMEKHGGTIRARSNGPDYGSVFTLFFVDNQQIA